MSFTTKDKNVYTECYCDSNKPASIFLNMITVVILHLQIMKAARNIWNE